jgi:hypothetical protein
MLYHYRGFVSTNHTCKLGIICVFCITVLKTGKPREALNLSAARIRTPYLKIRKQESWTLTVDSDLDFCDEFTWDWEQESNCFC